MGLFDVDTWSRPETAADMALAAGLLGGRGNLAGIFGRALMDRQNAGAQASEAQQIKNAREIEMQRARQMIEIQRKNEFQRNQRTTLAPQFYQSPQKQALAGGGGPTQAAAARLPGLSPTFDISGYANALLSRGDLEGGATALGLEKSDLIPLNEGQSLFSRSQGKVVGGTPKPQDVNQPFMRGPGGEPVPNPAYQSYALAKARAGSTQIPINVGEKNMFGNMGEAISKRIDTALIAGDAANQSVYRLQGLRDALNNKDIISGAGADARIVLSRIGKLIGVGGKNESETLANTAQVVQQLANLELDAAKGMRGQGAITENERALIRKAAAGDINMTVDELKALVGALDRQARFTIRWANDFTSPARQKAKGTVMEPYLQIQEPAEEFRIEKL